MCGQCEIVNACALPVLLKGLGSAGQIMLMSHGRCYHMKKPAVEA